MTRLIVSFAALAVVAFAPLCLAQTGSQSSSSQPELKVFDPTLIDKSVDPCDNFYRYSCNGWFKHNPLPADQTRY
jgi:putative endopeptidase